MFMNMRELAASLLQAYSDLHPQQQLEVLSRVWNTEDPAGGGMGKALLLSILTFESFGVAAASIPPESLVEAITVMREMAEKLKQGQESN
jgi:hypothetical protein